VIWCIAVTLLLGSAFREIGWSYVDTANNLSAAADSRSWHELASDALTKSVEYRPLLDLGTRSAYRVLGLNIDAYQAIVFVEFGVLLIMLVVLFRPSGWRRVAAAILALSVAVGLHTSRILFLFVPLNAYLTSLLLVLVAVFVVITPKRRIFEWVLLPLTMIALFWLELGVLIVPLVIGAWLASAPDTTWRSVVASAAGLAIYLVARLGFGPSMGPDVPDTGLGFSMLSAADRVAMFGERPWLLWLYNVGATLMTVVASEPRAGTFRFVAALRADAVPAWMWLHVVSSLLTTLVVCLAVPGIRARATRDRLIAVFGGVLLIGGSVLGFLYTRDRIGLAAGIGYAMLVYVAVTALLERPVSRWMSITATALVVMLGVGWSLRVGEMYVALRETAWDFHHEWTRDEAQAPADTIVGRMRAATLRQRPADPQHDPLWTYVLFERRFTREKETP